MDEKRTKLLAAEDLARDQKRGSHRGDEVKEEVRFVPYVRILLTDTYDAFAAKD